MYEMYLIKKLNVQQFVQQKKVETIETSMISTFIFILLYICS